MTEIWRDIPGHEGIYQASNAGRVRNVMRSTEASKPWLNWNGYLLIGLSRKKIALHRVIAMTFIGPCPRGKECAHLNGIRTDNRAVNLSYVTRKENHAHKKIHGTYQIGEKNSNSKLTAEQVAQMRAEYGHGNCTMKQLAVTYGVHSGTVWNIINNKTWKQS